MKKKLTLRAMMISILFAASPSFAGEVVIVPGVQAGASFISEKNEAEKTTQYFAVGENGAQAVLSGRALITATESSRFTRRAVSDGQSSFSFEEGVFQIEVGSKEWVFAIGHSKITAKEATISVVELDGGFGVRFDSRFKSRGFVKLDFVEEVTPETPENSVEVSSDPYSDAAKETPENLVEEILPAVDESNLTERERKKLARQREREAKKAERERQREARRLERERRQEERKRERDRLREERRLKKLGKSSQAVDSETAPPAPLPVNVNESLAVGQAFLVYPNAAPKAAPHYLKRVFKAAVSVFDVPASTQAKLVAQDVEHESDLVATLIDKDEAFADIEIEDIEVEAGCIEVCLD